jgi:hypothetical protein
VTIGVTKGEAEMTIFEKYRLHPWEETFGHLQAIQDAEGHCLVTIGQVCVVLPAEMADRLRKLLGRKVGILRTDSDYRFRVYGGGEFK